MRVVTYTGSDMNEVLTRIREEHGEDVIILSTQVERGLPVRVEIGLEEYQAPEPRAELPTGLKTTLAQQGLRPETITRLLKGSTSDDPLSEGIAREFQFRCQLPQRSRVVALVGPTGVGKTTTIAKLAAQMKIHFDATVGLISMDHFRVGAGFQLQTYAALMELPCRLLDPEKNVVSELQRALKAFDACDLILIDTVGCSWRDASRIQQIANTFDQVGDIESMLVLPAPGNGPDLSSAIKGFAPTGFQRAILSKLDESCFIGPVLDAALASNTGLAFFTSGQQVPEDIEPASAKRLAWLLRRVVH